MKKAPQRKNQGRSNKGKASARASVSESRTGRKKKPKPPRNLNLSEFAKFTFDAADVDVVLTEVGSEYSVPNKEDLRVDLTNDFVSFEMNRANADTYSAATRRALDDLQTSAKRTRRLFEKAMNSHFENTWLLNKAWQTWPEGDRRLVSIQSSLADLEKLLLAPDFRTLKFGISLEVQFIGITLPNTFERHFHRKYAIDHAKDQSPSGPGVRFVSACLRRKNTMNRLGKPFALETIVAHRTKARKVIGQHPELAVARAPVMIPK